MSAHRLHPRDEGFTLVEMLVAMSVFVIAIAALLPAIINTRDSTGRQASLTQADGDVKIASKLLERDVRAARGNRATGDRNGMSGLGTASTLYSLAQPLGAAHDIIVAEPKRLVLYADVLPEPVGAAVVPERVEWDLLADSATCGSRSKSNQNWCVVRAVTSVTGTTSEVVVSSRGSVPRSTSCFPPGVAPGPQDRMFCYETAAPTSGSYAYDGGWTAQCATTWQTGTGAIGTTPIGTRHNAVDTGTTLMDVDRIVTVGAALQSGGSYGSSAERSYEGTQVAVRSRESAAYREAIMCGSRIGWTR